MTEEASQSIQPAARRGANEVAFRLMLLFFAVFLVAAVFNFVIVWLALNALDHVALRYHDTQRTVAEKSDEIRNVAESIVSHSVMQRVESHADKVAFLLSLPRDKASPEPLQDTRLIEMIENGNVGQDGSLMLFDTVARTMLIRRGVAPGTPIAAVEPDLDGFLKSSDFLRQVEQQALNPVAGLQNRFISSSRVLDQTAVEAKAGGAGQGGANGAAGNVGAGGVNGGAAKSARRVWSATLIPGTTWALAGTASPSGVVQRLLEPVSLVLDGTADVLSETVTEGEDMRGNIVAVLAFMVVLGLVAFVALYTLVNRSIIMPIRDLTATAEMIRRGNYHVRATFSGQGEFGDLALAINNMLDRIVGLIESEEDKRKLHAQIIRLLDQVSMASQGDLTARGQVTDDILGSVTDAFNLMLESSGNLAIEVGSAGAKVTRSAGQLRTLASQLTDGAARQSAKIDAAVHDVESVASWIRQAAAQAGEAAMLSEQTASNATIGAQSVRDSKQGMTRIRVHVLTASKKIKNLGEKSLEINQIVELINDIAVQTNTLALNASIEASRAGEAGRGFAVVAEEVRKLAERVSAATRDISDFIEGVQQDANESVRAMEDVTREVEEGVSVSEQAGQALTRIAEVADATQQEVRTIYEDATAQAEAIESLVALQSDVKQITKSTEASARDIRQTVDELVGLSEALGEAIRRFKVQSAPAPIPLDDIENRKKELVFSLSYFGQLSERDTRAAAELKDELDAVLRDLARVAEKARQRIEGIDSVETTNPNAMQPTLSPEMSREQARMSIFDLSRPTSTPRTIPFDTSMTAGDAVTLPDPTRGGPNRGQPAKS